MDAPQFLDAFIHQLFCDLHTSISATIWKILLRRVSTRNREHVGDAIDLHTRFDFRPLGISFLARIQRIFINIKNIQDDDGAINLIHRIKTGS